ncbi:MAG: hypothetical protein NTU53_24480 [Planctomycetota bacterium]|nr:hypothetical protein [Planctomycetota bacterium]
MKLATRKLIILLTLIVVLAIANALAIVAWLDHSGIIDFARHIRGEYLTGTAIAVIAALLFLLTEPSCPTTPCAKPSRAGRWTSASATAAASLNMT